MFYDGYCVYLGDASREYFSCAASRHALPLLSLAAASDAVWLHALAASSCLLLRGVPLTCRAFSQVKLYGSMLSRAATLAVLPAACAVLALIGCRE